MVLGCCLIVGGISMIMSIINRKISGIKFDTPKYYVIWAFFQNCGDFWSDLFFSLILYFDKYFFYHYYHLYLQ